MVFVRARRYTSCSRRARATASEALFTRSRNIAVAEELWPIVAEAGADMARFAADREAGVGREAVLADYRRAVLEDRVRAIPTVIVDGTARFTGLTDLAAYRRAIEDAARAR